VIGFSDNYTNNSLLSTTLNEINHANHDIAINHYWVYALLFTTLIPTLVHFVLASTALVMWLPHTLRHKIANNLSKNHYKHWIAAFYLTITPVVGFLMPVLVLYILYQGLHEYSDELGGMLLEWAKMLARMVLDNPDAIK
jgi:uncharacterized membrane protein